LLGKDNITFTGINFPHDLEGNTFELAFDNSDKTTCEVVETSSTELVCLTSKFNSVADVDKTYGMTITINGLAVTQSLSFKTKTDI
jgi:hypothetical protein